MSTKEWGDVLLSSSTELPALWMSSSGCWCLHQVFLHAECVCKFLFRKDVISSSATISLSFYSHLFPARISSCMFFSIAECVFLALFGFVHVTKKEAIVLASGAFWQCWQGNVMPDWNSLMKSKPKWHNIFTLHVFKGNCLAKDGNTKYFTEAFNKKRILRT